jgi:hypothetical protein
VKGLHDVAKHAVRKLAQAGFVDEREASDGQGD